MLSAILITVLILALLTLFISYICFRIVFYAPKEKTPSDHDLPVPAGKAYEPYHAQMRQWILETRALKSEDYCFMAIAAVRSVI